MGDVDLFALACEGEALTVNSKWLQHLEDRLLGEDGHPRKAREGEDPHRCAAAAAAVGGCCWWWQWSWWWWRRLVVVVRFAGCALCVHVRQQRPDPLPMRQQHVCECGRMVASRDWA